MLTEKLLYCDSVLKPDRYVKISSMKKSKNVQGGSIWKVKNGFNRGY